VIRDIISKMTKQNKIDFDKKSPLQSYAYEWLKSRGLFDGDADYSGMLGGAVFELVKVFSKQGHSGFSAGLTKEMFYQLLSDFESGKDASLIESQNQNEKAK
jgi:hypothetical protein